MEVLPRASVDRFELRLVQGLDVFSHCVFVKLGRADPCAESVSLPFPRLNGFSNLETLGGRLSSLGAPYLSRSKGASRSTRLQSVALAVNLPNCPVSASTLRVTCWGQSPKACGLADSGLDTEPS